MGRVGKEAQDALEVLAEALVDILMLDMVGVIVVLAVGVNEEMIMFKSVSVSQMAASSRDKIVKLVSHIRWKVYEVC
jgi:hypothetical protein